MSQRRRVGKSKAVLAAAKVEPEKKESLESILRKIPIPNGTLSEEQIQMIVSLRWKDGTNLLNPIDLKSQRFMYEILGILLSDNEMQQNVQRLQTQLNSYDVQMKDITTVLLDSKAFKREKNMYLADKDRMRRSTEVVKGTEKCKKCGSIQTNTIEIQTRSGDEPMTHFTKCLACGFSWRD